MNAPFNGRQRLAAVLKDGCHSRLIGDIAQRCFDEYTLLPQIMNQFPCRFVLFRTRARQDEKLSCIPGSHPFDDDPPQTTKTTRNDIGCIWVEIVR